ncbi:MAG: hypothetical protein J6B87_00505 [Clostridia bacterium]|nr:hypothetical protein [Clostridia bacterium]
MDNKNEIKKEKRRLNKPKLLRNLLIACAIALLVNFILNKNVFEDMKIQNRVHSSLPISVTMQDALFVKTYSIDKYIAFIKGGETQKAYSMLTNEYKAYKTYDKYLDDIQGIDFSTFKLKEVKQISENTYLTPVEYERNGVLENAEYIVLANKLNDKNMKIAPNKFLYHFEEKQKFSKDSIKFTIEECIVEADAIKLTVLIKNSNLFEEIKITEIGVAFNELESKTQAIEDGILKPGESKAYDIEIESNYYIPKYLKVNRNIENETMRTYLFELENN